jgi:hypothetical protein
VHAIAAGPEPTTAIFIDSVTEIAAHNRNGLVNFVRSKPWIGWQKNNGSRGGCGVRAGPAKLFKARQFGTIAMITHRNISAFLCSKLH